MQPGDHLADATLSAAIDNQLSAEAARDATAHLETCSVCLARLGELRAVVELLGALPVLEPPRDFSIGPRRVVDPPNVVRLRRWYGALRVASATLAAAFVFLAAGSLYVASQPVPTTSLVAERQVASAPAPPVPAAQSDAAAPKAAPAAPVRQAAPAAGAAARASAPPADQASGADQVQGARSVGGLPTPVPTLAPAPTPFTQPAPAVQTYATSRPDAATPLRTAAAVAGVLAALGLLVAAVVRHRISSTE